jgi:hypothetical protein
MTAIDREVHLHAVIHDIDLHSEYASLDAVSGSGPVS